MKYAGLVIGILLTATFFTLAACDPNPPMIEIVVK